MAGQLESDAVENCEEKQELSEPTDGIDTINKNKQCSWTSQKSRQLYSGLKVFWIYVQALMLLDAHVGENQSSCLEFRVKT